MSEKEEIAIIGGGLGGVMTALMLAKDPTYHVTLIEAQDGLLKGASSIAARLHLGGEYPLDPSTANDCLMGAVIWKLLMPNHGLDESQENIYTPVPPMKFTVGKETHAYGEAHPDEPGTLTLEKYHAAYRKIRDGYEDEKGYHEGYRDIFEKVKQGMGWDDATTAKALFGMPDDLIRPLEPEELRGYDKLVPGGFQSQELGLNIPKYLTMLVAEIESLQEQGRLTLMTNHKVQEIETFDPEDTASGPAKFRVQFEMAKPVDADQVVVAAWQGGPELTGVGMDGEFYKGITVSKRAMLIIDTPPGFSIPPAFIMQDGMHDDGAMLAAFNDKVALCYLPPKRIEEHIEGIKYNKPTAYIKDTLLTDDNDVTSTTPSMPMDWRNWNQPMQLLGSYLGQYPGLVPEHDAKDYSWTRLQPQEKWTETYLALAKKRFPELEGATNARLAIFDTMNFQTGLHLRRHEAVEEVENDHLVHDSQNITLRFSQRTSLRVDLDLDLDLRPEERQPVVEDEKRHGLFTLYPTKATYSVHAALQAAAMVQERSARNQNPGHPDYAERVSPPENMLETLLAESVEQARQNIAHYSQGHMPEPSPEQYTKYFAANPHLSPKMLEPTWGQQPSEQQAGTNWVERSATRENGGQDKGRVKR